MGFNSGFKGLSLSHMNILFLGYWQQDIGESLIRVSSRIFRPVFEPCLGGHLQRNISTPHSKLSNTLRGFRLPPRSKCELRSSELLHNK